MSFEDFFTRIETQYSNQLPFVVYRKPRENILNVLLQPNDGLHEISDFTEKGFVFAPFKNKGVSILIPCKDSEFISVQQKELPTVEASKNHEFTNETDKKLHVNLVEKAIDIIKKGVFKKVVLSRKETVAVHEKNPIELFKQLLAHYKSSFNYCWYHPKIGLWLGATPETLIKIEGNQFSIMALAGTQVYNGTMDVVWQEKEVQEQKIVTDFIIDNLKPSVESLHISETETVKAGSLLHLKTMISARLKPNASLADVINVIHPTPAVCGMPKDTARQFILDNEHYEREYYTGFLGELNFETSKAPRSGSRNVENRAYAITKKSTQLYVNLRCMQLENGNAHIYIGGGVTAHSNPESEWEETVSKSLIIKNIL